MASDGDRDLEELFASYVDRLNDGEELDEERILAENPILGVEILDHLKDYVGTAAVSARGNEDAPLGTLGDYTLRRQIGRGGMGVVYEAWQGSMDRRVALKVLPAGIAADDRAFQRFMQEARAAGKLSHPSIVAVHAMGQEASTPYYAMDFVDGETLAQVVARSKHLEPGAETVFGPKDSVIYFGKLAAAFADVADGLQHAHTKKVIHRDIKPSNLILDGAGRLRILDFGLARLEGQESLTVSGDLVGTPQYMSPEQARRRKVPIDHRTDIYSLGATLYELLTLRPPFRGRDHADTLSQIIERDPVEPKRIQPSVPRDLETIVLKCLRKEAGERYGTAEALGQDLRRFVGGEAVEARPETTWERAARRLERHRKAIVAGACAAGLIAIGLVATTLVVARAYRDAEDSRLETARQLYVSDMRLAMADWEAGSFASFEELVERHRPAPGEPDLRGWEWRYLESLRHVPLRTIEVDPGGALAVAWNPKGETIAVGGDAGYVSVYRVADGERVHQLRVADSPARAVAWSPDGDRVLGLAHDGTVRCWRLTGEQEVFAVLPEQERPPGRELRSAGWSPDGAWLATAEGDRTVKIRDGATGNLVNEIPANETDCVTCVEWSPDGRQLAASFRSPTFVVVWEAGTWRELRRGSPNPGYLYFAAWSPDGDKLAMGVDAGRVHLWDAATLQPAARMLVPGGSVFAGRWSPDGKRFASGGGGSLVNVWRADQLDEADGVLRGHRESVWSMAWSPDGTRLASASGDGTVQIWDPNNSWAGRSFPGEYTAAWSLDGRWLASLSKSEDRIIVRDTGTWKIAAKIPFEGWTRSLSINPDGSRLAATGPGDKLGVHDCRRGIELVAVKERHGGATPFSPCAAWSPSGDWIASGGADGVPRIWGGVALELVKELPRHARPLGAVAWSPDGSKLATTSIDLVLKVCESGTWRQLQELRRRQSGVRQGNYSTGPYALCWSPDGGRLAVTVSHLPNPLAVFDVTTGEQLQGESGHTSGLMSVAWSPDGARIATGGGMGDVTIWSTDRWEPVVQFGKQSGAVTALLWSPDGRWLVSGTGSGLKVWDGGSSGGSK